jgi:hypothetical protein
MMPLSSSGNSQDERGHRREDMERGFQREHIAS